MKTERPPQPDHFTCGECVRAGSSAASIIVSNREHALNAAAAFTSAWCAGALRASTMTMMRLLLLLLLRLLPPLMMMVLISRCIEIVVLFAKVRTTECSRSNAPRHRRTMRHSVCVSVYYIHLANYSECVCVWVGGQFQGKLHAITRAVCSSASAPANICIYSHRTSDMRTFWLNWRTLLYTVSTHTARQTV